MKENEKKPFIPPERPEEPAPRDDIHVAESRLRCPYCHDTVDAASTGWIACRGCLARHHAECWRESGRCAACSEKRALVGAPPRRLLVALGLIFVLLVGLTLAYATRATPTPPPSRPTQPERARPEPARSESARPAPPQTATESPARPAKQNFDTVPIGPPAMGPLRRFTIWHVGEYHWNSRPQAAIEKVFSVPEFKTELVRVNAAETNVEVPDVLVFHSGGPVAIDQARVLDPTLVESPNFLGLGLETFLVPRSPHHAEVRAEALETYPFFPWDDVAIEKLGGTLASETDVATLTKANESVAARVAAGDVKDALSGVQTTKTPFFGKAHDLEVVRVKTRAILGNKRLAFAFVTMVFQSPTRLGSLDLLVVWTRDDAGQWRLLEVSSDGMTRLGAEKYVPALVKSLSDDDAPGDVAPATLLEPRDGAFPSPPPGAHWGDLTWKPSPSDGVVAEVCELGYGSGTRLYFDKRVVSASELMPLKESWTWRVWTIAKNGRVVLSESRTFQH